MKHLLIFLMMIAAGMTACQSGKDTHEHGHAANGSTYTCPMHPQVVQQGAGICPICHMDLVPVSAAGAGGQEIVLGEPQLLLGNIHTQVAGTDSIGATTILAGKIVENKALTEVVASRAAGRVEKLYIRETGQRVQQGQPLYELYSEALLTYQREYLMALEQLRQVDSSSQRYASLLSSAHRKLLLYGMTEAQVETLAQRKSTQPAITFLSPLSGLVTDIRVTEGQYVGEGSVLYAIEQLDRLWVEAEMYPGEAGLVNPGETVQVVAAGYEASPVKGEIVFLSPEYRAGTQVITLRVAIDNPEGQWMPGMQASVVLRHTAQEHVAVPVDAVIRGGSGSHVWVQQGKGTFVPRTVQTGMENGLEIEITEGLQAGDSVVVSGAYLLYSEYILKKGGDPASIQSAAEALSTATGEPAVFDDKAMQQAYGHYMQVQQALVDGNTGEARQAAEALHKTLGSLAEAQAAAEAARKLSEANTLQAQRQAFTTASERMISLVKAVPPAKGTLYVAFCPMASNNQGGSWLSAEQQIRNPYFGDMMLQCGEIREAIP